MNIGVKTLLIVLCFMTILNVIFSCPKPCRCKSNDHVICKKTSFSSVPSDIPIGVTYLDLSVNRIKELPADSFKRFSLLRTLKLNHNDMKSIHENAFRGLNNLKELYLVHNDLSNLQPNTFKDLNKLLHVYLGNNEFQSIPVLKATQMTKLNLDSNHINDAFINESFLLNTGLKTIVLTNNDIKIINKTDFVNLRNTQLISIMLKFNSLENIDPEAFTPVKGYLQNLELEGNKLLTSAIIENALKGFQGGGRSLIYLDLRDCGLTSISINFFKPLFDSKLHQLDISHNSQLKSIDVDAFDGLKNLQFLRMTNCEISSAKIRFSALAKLRELHISHNNFTKCPYRLPGSLLKIDLQSNNIRKILKDDFKSLTELRELNLRNNAILSIEPESFIDLNQLETLDLSFNRLAHIGSGVFIGMSALVRLDLSKQNPCIVTVDTNAFVLANLQSLNLHGNCITLPTSDTGLFSGIPLLTNVSLADNRLLDLPGSLFKGCDNVKNIDLSHNRLLGWSAMTFTTIRKTVEYLDLGFNQISSVSLNLASRNYLPNDFVAIRTVVVDNNIWNCTCPSVSWLVRYRAILKNRDKIICHEPNEKAGRRLLALMVNCSQEVAMNRLVDTAHAVQSHDGFWVFSVFLVTLAIVVSSILFGMAWKCSFPFRRQIYSNYRKWKQSRNPYNNISSLNDSMNDGYTNEYLRDDAEEDHFTNRLVIDEPCTNNVPLAPTWETRVRNAPKDEEMESIDIVLVTSEIHRSLMDKSTIVVKQICALDTDQTKLTVYQSAKLAIDYPPPDPDVLRHILDMRTGDKKNFLLLSYDNEAELDGANSFYTNYEIPIHRYDSASLLTLLIKIY